MRIFALTLFLFGCASVPVARLPGGSEWVLSGPLEAAFKAITFHDTRAITLSDRVTLYGTGEPPDAQLQCHEEQHRMQAYGIAESLIAIRAIEDTSRARMLAWLAVYGQEYLQHGYRGNRFERRAREMCEQP